MKKILKTLIKEGVKVFKKVIKKLVKYIIKHWHWPKSRILQQTRLLSWYIIFNIIP